MSLCLPVYLASLLISIIDGQSCQGGSFYDNENPTPYSIETGNWYLNVERPCQCSGELQSITVQYSMLQSKTNNRVTVAVWTPVEDGGDSYSVVASTIDELRRNTNSPNAPLSAGYAETSSVNNVFVRKGAIIGVFFELNRTPLPVIGTVSGSTNYIVCRLTGTETETTMINCTSNMISNLIIDAEMDINIIACMETDIPTVENGNYTLIDGDVEYGARVQYSCDPGYVINVEDNFLQCNEQESWIGTIPICTFVEFSSSESTVMMTSSSEPSVTLTSSSVTSSSEPTVTLTSSSESTVMMTSSSEPSATLTSSSETSSSELTITLNSNSVTSSSVTSSSETSSSENSVMSIGSSETSAALTSTSVTSSSVTNGSETSATLTSSSVTSVMLTSTSEPSATLTSTSATSSSVTSSSETSAMFTSSSETSAMFTSSSETSVMLTSTSEPSATLTSSSETSSSETSAMLISSAETSAAFTSSSESFIQNITDSTDTSLVSVSSSIISSSVIDNVISSNPVVTNSVSVESEETTAMIQSTSLHSSSGQITVSNSITPSDTVNIGSGAAGGNSSSQTVIGVLTVFVVILIVMVTVIVIVIVMKKRNKKRSQRLLICNVDDSLAGFTNEVYQTNLIGINDTTNFTNPTYEGNFNNPVSYHNIYEPIVQEEQSGSKVYHELEPMTSEQTIKQFDNSLYAETLSSANTEQYYSSVNFDSATIRKEDLTIYSSEQQLYSVLEAVRGESFSEDPIYWPPEADAMKIYEQIAMKKYREIPRERIKITDHLGSGQFGTVDKGEWSTARGTIEVAIKTLKGLATDEEETKFLQEAAINGQFHHPNVVQLCGVVTVGQPTLLVLEYMPNGDLKQFLEKKQPLPGELADDSLPDMLINFSYQLACGMVYLSKKHFIHRDLAARNILVGYSNNVCKIADFGMSRDLQDEAYYRSENRRIPVKWTAPEAINYRKYSTQSDVWSFGALLFEIWSVGYKPFQIYTNAECMTLVDSGWRLPSPPGCPRSIYELMIMCWNPDASCRPAFDFLQSNLSKTESVLQAAQQLKASLGTLVQWDQSLYPDLQNMYK